MSIKFRNFRLVISEKSKMSLPIRGQGGHLWFSDRPQKHKLGRQLSGLASCQVWLSSLQPFHRRSQKCEKSSARNNATSDKWGLTIIWCSLVWNSLPLYPRFISAVCGLGSERYGSWKSQKSTTPPGIVP